MSLADSGSEPVVDGTSRATREQQAVAELGRTRYSPGVREALVIVFLLTIVAVPLLETIADLRSNRATRQALLAQGVDPRQWPGRRPHSFDVLNLLPSWHEVAAARSVNQWVDLLPEPRRLRQYEDLLVLNSAAGKLVRPWMQWVLTKWMGIGNEKVYLGRDRSLFYSDGFAYVTGQGFLDPQQHDRKPSEVIQSDPRPAIRQLYDELKRLGVTLIVFPTPDKVMIHPESFSPRAHGTTVAQNASWHTFRSDLERYGIPIFDVGDQLYKEEAAGTPQFLLTDSHWSPAGVDVAARALADYLRQHVGITPAPHTSYSRRQVEVVREGDLVKLLNLPKTREQLFSPSERLTAWAVFTPDGFRWQPDVSSDVLMIGDSFLEIYSTNETSPSAAGLAEQLSYYLQHPIDRVASHNWGKYGVREALGDSLAQLRQRASGRKVIIWQFAVRKLASDDWPLMQ